MANVKTTLTIAGNGTSNSFSNSKNYTEETVTKFYVDATDTFTDLIAFSPDDESPTKTATSTAAPKSFCIYNSGTTGAEIQITNAKWAHAAPDTLGTAGAYNSFLLGAGDFMYLPALRAMSWDSANSAGNARLIDNEAPDSNMYIDSGVDSNDGTGDDITGSASVTNLILEADGDTNYFHVGDLIRVNNEIMEVTAVGDDSDAANTNLTVIRGVYGSTAASDHADAAAIRIPFFNM